VSCGDQFAYACSTESGEVWSVGENAKGQLGLGHQKNAKQCTRVVPLCQKGVFYIDCGMQFVYLIGAAAEVYVVGSNFLGKLGLGYNGGCETLPVKNAFYSGRGAFQVALGMSYAWVLTKGANLYSCGGNLHGELGLGTEYGEDSPKKIEFFEGKNIKRLVPGHECVWAIYEPEEGGEEHTKVYACGRNDIGQLGCGNQDGLFCDRRDRRVPSLAPPLAKGRVWAMFPMTGCYHGDNIYIMEREATGAELAMQEEERMAAMRFDSLND